MGRPQHAASCRPPSAPSRSVTDPNLTSVLEARAKAQLRPALPRPGDHPGARRGRSTTPSQPCTPARARPSRSQAITTPRRPSSPTTAERRTGRPPRWPVRYRTGRDDDRLAPLATQPRAARHGARSRCSCCPRSLLYAVFVLFPIVQAVALQPVRLERPDAADRLRRAGQLPAGPRRPGLPGRASAQRRSSSSCRSSSRSRSRSGWRCCSTAGSGAARPAAALLRAVRHLRGHHRRRLEPDPPAGRPRRRRARRRSASGRSTSRGWPTRHGPAARCSSIISWKYFGFHMILLLAGLQGIPRELEEAAAIDGAIAPPGDPLRHPAAARADAPGLGLPVDHRRAPAVRPRLGHDRRRAGQRLEHDGDLHVRPGLRALPARLRQRGRGDPVRRSRSSSPWPTSASCCAATSTARSRRGLGRWRRCRSRTSPRDRPRVRLDRGRRPASLRWAILLGLAARDRHPDRRTRSSAGSGTTASSRPTPSACPTRGSPRTTPRSSASASFWQQLGNSILIAVLSTVVVVAVRGARGVRLRARRVPRPRGRCSRCSRSGCCSRPPSRSCRCSSCSATSGCSTTRSGSRCPRRRSALPLTIIILRPFFRSIPVELEDAAAIDGCSPFGFFWRILLPLSRPALATVAVLAIVSSWNAFLLPLVMLSDPDELDAAARASRTSRPSTRRHGADPRLHDAVADPGARVLRRRRAPARRRPDRRGGEGLMTTDRRRATATPALPVDARVADLLARMTLRREARPARARSGRSSSSERDEPRPGAPRRPLARTASARSPGWPARPTSRPTRSREAGNAIQRFLVEETRLGIPAIIHEECAPRPARPRRAVLPAVDRRGGDASTPSSSTASPTTIRRRMLATGARHALAPGARHRAATRAGAGSRRPTARTRTSPPSSACAYVRGAPGRGPRDGRRRHRQAPRRPRPGRGRAQPGARPRRAARAARRAAVPVRGGGPRRRARQRHAGLLRRRRRARATPRASC